MVEAGMLYKEEKMDRWGKDLAARMLRQARMVTSKRYPLAASHVRQAKFL